MRTALFATLLAIAGAAVDARPATAGGSPAKPPVDSTDSQFETQYASTDAALRAKAVELLLQAPDAKKLSLLSSHVIGKEKRADVVARAVAVLSRIKDEKVVAALVAASRGGAADVRGPYVEAMGAMTASPAAHAALLELVKDKDAYVRGMACASLGEHRAMDALAPLSAAIDDRSWVVQTAALAALPRLSDKEELKRTVVPKLVDFLETVSGRLQADAADALRRITGRNLGREPSAWRSWLTAGRPEAPVKEDAENGEATAEKPAYANQSEKPHYYGMEVVSNRVVLVLDVSLSMYDPIDIDKDRLRRETSRRRDAVTGGGKKDPDKKDPEARDEDQGYDIPWWKIKTRLDLAKYQTINLVSLLREEQQFEIITFSKEVKPWMGRLVPATSANKQKAIAMLETIKPEDATNTWGGLAAAFDMVDAEKKGDRYGPDELYFVTDGAPSLGDIVDPNQIADAVAQLEKVKPLRINVVGIGVDLAFLRKIARDTGGRYKAFRSESSEEDAK